MEVADTFAFLLGRWQIERTLTDHRSGISGTFTGTAEILPPAGMAAGTGGESAVYGERGVMRFGAHTGPATRRLECRRLADGTADIRFADGREFYLLDLRPGHARAEHLCGADRYLARHRVLGASLVEVRWWVSGPRKDYQTLTMARRVPPATAAHGSSLASR